MLSQNTVHTSTICNPTSTCQREKQKGLLRSLACRKLQVSQRLKVFEVLKIQEVLTMAGTVLDCVRVINQDSPIWEVKYRQLRKEQHMREAEEKFAMKW